MPAIFRELNTGDLLTGTIKDADGDAVDLSAVDHISLTVRRRRDGEIIVDHQAMEFVDDGSDGQVKYQFSAEEIAEETHGGYELQVEVWPTAEESQTVEDADGLEIREHFGTHA